MDRAWLAGISLLTLCATGGPATAQIVTIEGAVTPWDGVPVSSPWNVGDILYVGRNGDGALTISDGGEVEALSTFVGYWNQDTGSVTLTDSGSMLSVDGTLYIGGAEEATGHIAIVEGGQASANYATIGYSGGAVGHAAVTGPASRLSVNQNFTVGAYGSATGYLTVSGGGIAEAGQHFVIGAHQNTQGYVTVTGSGSTLTAGSDLYIGGTPLPAPGSPTGHLVISDGGTFSAGRHGAIGWVGDAEGFVTVTGSNSTFEIGNVLYIGGQDNTLGVLTIEDGGTATVGQHVVVGTQGTAEGHLTVTGAGSTLSANQRLAIGNNHNATGHLTVSGGGTVTIGQDIGLGLAANTTGHGTITGAGSVLATASDLIVGEAGTGTLIIADGGLVRAAETRVAERAGSNGTLRLEGGGSSGLLETGQVSRGLGDSASVVFDGGTLRLTQNVANLFDGFSSGEVMFEGGGATIDTQAFVVATAQSFQGEGGLTKLGSGTLTLQDAQDYSGATVVGEGTLWLGGATSGNNRLSEMTALVVESGATVAFGSTSQRAGSIAGAGRIEAAYISATDVYGGTLSIGEDARSSQFSGELLVGTLNKSGTGNQTLSGTHAVRTLGIYGGGVRIGAGGWAGIDGTVPNVVLGGGVLDLDGHVLAIGTVSNVFGPGNIQLGAGGTLVLTDGRTTFNGEIGGNGTVVKQGTGTFTLARATTFSGLLDIQEGAVRVSAAGGALSDGVAVNIANGALLDLDGNSERIGALSGLGEVALGSGTLTIAEGGAAFGGTISGTGTLNMAGSGVQTLTGNSSGFSGTVVVSSGAFTVDGIFGGNVEIDGGGTLAGIGTVGGFALNSGGILAPGNSIGTLTVAGHAAFNAGSTYVVEINNGPGLNLPGINNDLVVADTASIAAGAVFHVVPEDGATLSTAYTPNTVYTIIQTAAPGNLTIAGAPIITDAFAFLSFTGHDDGQNYYLTSSAIAASFCLPGASFNQCQTGEAVRELGPGSIAYDMVVGMSEANANAAFNALSGEVHASGQYVINQSVALFSGTLRDQASAGIAGSASGDQIFVAPLGYGPATTQGPAVMAIASATVPAPIDARVPQAWLAPLGGRGVVDADGNAGRLDLWTAGLAGGYEGPIEVADGAAYAGFGLGYLRSRGAVDARLSSFDADGFHIGAYGGWEDGPLSVAGSLVYAANQISTERRIAFGAINQTATADYWSHTIGFSGEAAYGFELTDATTISPLFILDASWSGHGGFTETGAGALNLSGASENWTRLDAGIGLAVSHVIFTETGKVTLDGRLLWEHAFSDVVPNRNLAFAGSPTGFAVNGPDAGRDRFKLGAGIAYQVTADVTIRASYDAIFSGSQQTHFASFGLNFKF